MPVQCTCFTCGKAFTRRPSSVFARTYCSPACQKARGPVPPIALTDDGTTAMIPLYDIMGNVVARVLVDAADAEWVNQWRWHMDDKGYATRGIRPNGKPRNYRLHSALMGMPFVSDGREVDHKDRTPLNCRRSNLRVLPKDGNDQNVPSYRGSSSQYRGVSWHKGSQKWVARVTIEQKTVHIGRFDDEHAAGAAALSARRTLLPFSVD